MKKLIYVFGLALLFASCNKPEEMTITANVQDEEEVIVLNMKEPLDTIKVEGDGFKIGMPIDTANFYFLFLPKATSYITLYIQPLEQIEIDIVKDGAFVTYEVNGSSGSERLQRIYESNLKTYRLTDSLNESLNKFQTEGLELPPETKQHLDERYRMRIEKHRQEVLAIIDEDTTNMINMMAISQSMGKAPLFPYDEFKSYYKMIDRNLMKDYPDNENVLEFHSQIDQHEASAQYMEQYRKAQESTAIGQVAPNIAMPDVDGNIRELYDLKGKVVILDFWASWCLPCRNANPELVKTYNKYKNRGFDVFSVSLDGLPKQPNPREEWLAAIEKDNLSWENHVSDMQGWQSAAPGIFGFNGIPHTILLDKEGKIVAKNLKGAALEAKIEELL